VKLKSSKFPVLCKLIATGSVLGEMSTCRDELDLLDIFPVRLPGFLEAFSKGAVGFLH